MSTYQNPIVVGVFQKESDAKRAIDDLRDAGFAKDQLGFAMREGGAVTSNLLNDLTSLGVPQDRAAYYNQQYEAGRTVVSVRADGRERDAANILGNYGATGYNDAQNDYYDATLSRGAAASTYNNTQTTDAAYAGNRANVTDQEHRSMQLREEQLQAEKHRVQAGEVRLHKDVVTEQRSIDVPVTHEEVYVEQHAVNPRVSDAPIGQGESIRVPVSEEQVNVTKNTVTTGEVEIGKRAVTENKRITDTVRHEEARIEREGDARINTNDTIDRDKRGNI